MVQTMASTIKNSSNEFDEARAFDPLLPIDDNNKIS